MKKVSLTTMIVMIIGFAYSQSITKFINIEEDGKKRISINKAEQQTQENVSNFNYRSVVWSIPENVSVNENEDSRDMSIVMDLDSVLHLVYCDDIVGLPGGYCQRIIYRSKPYDGEWSDGLIIDEFSGISPRNNHEASIEVSPNGDLHVVFHYWAYDGTFRDQIGYSKFTKSTETWSTSLISGDAGTIYSTYSDYPKVASTNTNIPMVVWGNDNRNGSEEVYLVYNNGIWNEPILVSDPQANKAQFPVIVSIEDEQAFILFREYNNTGDSLCLYFRIFDASNGTISEIYEIQESRRHSTSNFDTFHLYDACYVNSGKVFIAYNSGDSISSYYYDVNSMSIQKNQEVYRSNYNNYTNYNLLSVCADDDELIHMAYAVWNVNFNSVKYITYNDLNGFSISEIVSSTVSIDAPQMIYGSDHKLHIIYADDSEDTNNDGYIDREVYYIVSSNTVAVDEYTDQLYKLLVYPNPSNNGIFEMETNEELHITIRDVNGKIVFQKYSSSIIDISEYPDGLYFLFGNSKTRNFYCLLIKG